jgi:hypothetical protein
MEPLNANRRSGYSLVVAGLMLLSLAATPSQSWGAGVIAKPHLPPRSTATIAPLPPAQISSLRAQSTVTPTKTVIATPFYSEAPVYQPPSAGTGRSNSTTSGGPRPLAPPLAPGSQSPSTITSTVSTPSTMLASSTTLTPSTTPTLSAPPAFSQPPSTYTPTAPCRPGIAIACTSGH